MAESDTPTEAPIYDARNPPPGITVRQTFAGHPGETRDVAWSPDGRTLATCGGEDHVVLLWDAETGDHVRTLEGHTGHIQSVSWSPDGRLLASGGSDRVVRVWDAETGEPPRQLEGHTDWVRSVSWSPDGRLLASGGDDNVVRVWDAQTGEALRQLEGHTNWVQSVSWSPDGRLLASGGRENVVRVWDAETGEALRQLEGHTGVVQSVSWSPDGRLLASGGMDSVVRVWDAETGEALRQLEGHTGYLESVSWSPDGRLLTSSGDDKVVRVWDAETGEALRRLEGHEGCVDSASWSADGWSIASGGRDDVVRVWEAATGNPLHELTGHSGDVGTVSWSPGGRILASGADDASIRLWDAQSGSLLRTLEGHTGPVTSVHWSSDGRMLVSSSMDGTHRLWRTDRWEAALCLRGVGFAGPFATDYRAFQADAPTLALPGPDQAGRLGIVVYDLDVDVLLARAADSAPSSVHYTNAKVVLVGDTGVGKTGLGYVLAGEGYRKTDSTQKRNVWTFALDEIEEEGTLLETRETLLWDLPGQPGYRLVNQLSLREVAVGLVVIDARSETDPFAGVAYWAKALDRARATLGSAAPPLTTHLVAARMDRGGLAASPARIDQERKGHGFAEYFETSAMEGDGVEGLAEAIGRSIDWDAMPKVTSTELFRRIQTFLVARKAAGQILCTEEELYRAFVESSDDDAGDPQREFGICIGLVEGRGLIKRLSFGGLVLLQPEYLDAYASSIVNAARAEPDGMGCVLEEDVQRGGFDIPSDVRVDDAEQEKLLLAATIEGLLQHEAALREHADDGTYLVFPSELTRERPTMRAPEHRALTFAFDGPVDNIYAALAVRLAHSGVFAAHEMWQNAATYRASHGGPCGMYLDETDEGSGAITLFFEDTTSEAAQLDFEKYVERHLEARALRDTVVRTRHYACAACGVALTDQQVEANRARGSVSTRARGAGRRSRCWTARNGWNRNTRPACLRWTRRPVSRGTPQPTWPRPSARCSRSASVTGSGPMPRPSPWSSPTSPTPRTRASAREMKPSTRSGGTTCSGMRRSLSGTRGGSSRRRGTGSSRRFALRGTRSASRWRRTTTPGMAWRYAPASM
ncbi:hypothetical protein HN766_14445 [Candidatus Poribacteria bacterium]|nr:hypothetical protein [Candidatus Poribacteria bacterium]